MGKIAFLFPGQGAQFPGMGAGLYENIPESREIFEKAEKIRPDITRLILNGTEDELKITANTQPALFTVEMATAAALDSAGIKADMTAGFSLGELSALTYAGVFDLETGVSLVSDRGRMMQDAAEKADTSMVAVVRLENEKVEELCSEFAQVYPVNYNCPGQVSVAGLSSNIPAFGEAVKAAGGRAIPIKVSGGFHSPFMAEAAEEFGKELDNAKFAKPEIPVYSNSTGEIYSDDIRPVLKKQIDNPVRWQKIIEKMIENGADTFIEVGPGKVLSGFVSKINKDVRAFNVIDVDDIEKLKEML